MFNIAVKQEEYLIYILKDIENDSRLEIVPEKGGIVTNWKIQGQNILYLDQERFKNPSLSVRGGIPVLFPICGNLPENIFYFEDKKYILKQHGFARDLPWKVIGQSHSKSAKIILSLKSNQETLEVYPFEFELIFSYELLGKKLIIEQSYENKSNKKMPFSTGFHPYFYCGNKDKLKLNIPATEYQNKTGDKTFSFDGNLDYNSPEIDIAFTKLQGNKALFTDEKRDLTVKVKYDDFFSTLVFWTLEGKEYICLEPWSSPRNSINTKEQLKYLQPQEIFHTQIEIEVS
ncbi:aldose epimerase [Cyanobacterium aponinum FACHB-4101]|uniref:aldose epimerase family protein n=1 Tax=Cyanobacterium aponinum TaxID=379064 RepID=UPI00167FE866|nr:aldose epimerase [Cyanobacterium aponinum]MBD2395276.1 aldose epimerase [Cyanobacterium aponinum FACHB-4101]